MLDRVLVDMVVIAHLAFVLFAVAGGLLILHRRAWLWLHVPALVWATWIEASGGICPLTPLENALRARAGLAGYSGGFIEHHIVGLLYPAGLTRPVQIALATALLGVNAGIYAYVWRRAGRSP